MNKLGIEGMDGKIEYIREQLNDMDNCIQIAEEASELAKAALKYIRVKYGNSPTPVSVEEAEQNLKEEIADIKNAILIHDRYNSWKDDITDIMHKKLDRAIDRFVERSNK